MPERSGDWLKQAERALEVAKKANEFESGAPLDFYGRTSYSHWRGNN